MTNTPQLPSDMFLDVPMSQLIEEAEGFGADHGRSVSTWMTINSESGARHLLQLIEDGDPMQDEYDPSDPFDGQWADGKTVRDLIEEDLNLDPDSVTDEERDALVSAYEQAYRDAYWEALETRLREYVADCRAELESEQLAGQA